MSYAMSSKRRNLVFAFVFLLLALLAVLDLVSRKLDDRVGISSKKQQLHGDYNKYHGRSFVVVKVVDGDTLDINIPDGNHTTTRIRLWGVDTPETSKSPAGQMYYGPEASKFVSELVHNKNVTVYLDPGNNSRGKYKRLLAYLQMEDGRYLNSVIISEGYGYADLRFEHSWYNTYKQQESAARSQKKGLWRGVRREMLPGWLQRERPGLLKNDN